MIDRVVKGGQGHVSIIIKRLGQGNDFFSFTDLTAPKIEKLVPKYALAYQDNGRRLESWV